MAVVARLHALAQPDANRAPSLEVGYADAGNLLALCAARPGALELAIDRDEKAIERGRRLADATGLERAEAARRRPVREGAGGRRKGGLRRGQGLK